MKYKKSMIIVMLAIFLFAVAAVGASDVNDAAVASEYANHMYLSAGEEITADNQQISEKKLELSVDDESLSVESETEVLGDTPATYSQLAEEIYKSGNVILTHKNYNYNYNEGAKRINITEDNKVIDGNGAVIDMNGSTISAFYVRASGVTIKNLTIKNANYNGDGGAIYFSSSATSGTVTNCNFVDNKATGDYSYGGAVYFNSNGEIKNCNFINNSASKFGGAVYFIGNGEIKNCNFINNHADQQGGAVYFTKLGNVTNCNFTNNSAKNCGAIFFVSTSYQGTVTNCNFVNNRATTDRGGAIYIGSGSGTVTNCNFTNNSARNGGAVYIHANGNLTKCNFINNTASADGGAVYIHANGNLTNCNFINNTASANGGAVYISKNSSMTNCNFADTGNNGIDIYCENENGATVDTCIFKTSPSTYNTIILPPNLNVSNFTAFYGSDEKLTFDLKTNSSIPVTNGNISISIYNKTNGKWIRNYSCLSGDNWTVNMPAGEYYAIYNTEYWGFTPVNRTITIIKANSTITLNDIVLTYGESIEVSVATEGANSITAKIDNNDVTVINKFTIPISGLNAGNYTLTVTTMPDRDHNSVTKSVNLTVNKATAEIIINQDTFVLNATDVVGGSIAYLEPDVGNLTYASSNEDVVIVKDNEFIAVGAGKANITVSFTGNENYAPSMNKTVEFSVNAIPTSISVDKTEFVLLVGDEANIIETVTPEGIAVKYATDDDNIVSVDDKGHIKAVGEGTAIILVSVGDDRVYKYSAVEVSVKVSKIPTQITTSALTTVYNANEKLIVTLKDNKGNPISGVSITVNLKGTKTYKTDKNGQIKISTKGLAPKKYTAKITFNGDKNYAKSAKNVKVTVKKAKTKITAKKKVTYKAKAKTKKLKITLKDNNGKPIKNAKVRLMLKKIGKGGKKNTKTKANKKIAKTNKKGKATFKINKNKKAKYQAYVKFYANKYYKKTIKELKITIK